MKFLITLLLIAFFWSSIVYSKNECALLPVIPENQILVGWITHERITTQFSSGDEKGKTTSVGAFRLVGAIEDNKIINTIGSSIKNGQTFWTANNPKNSVILDSVEGFLDQINYAHCVYFASIKNNQYPRWTLFTSKPTNKFRTPSEDETNLFYKLNQTCVDQGDYPTGQEPSCTKPTLLAITDINKDSKLEFWATEPYKWDDGLTIWEYNGKGLIRIFAVCVGCSD